jgi:hypothetical protein
MSFLVGGFQVFGNENQDLSWYECPLACPVKQAHEEGGGAEYEGKYAQVGAQDEKCTYSACQEYVAIFSRVDAVGTAKLLRFETYAPNEIEQARANNGGETARCREDYRDVEAGELGSGDDGGEPIVHLDRVGERLPRAMLLNVTPTAALAAATREDGACAKVVEDDAQ